MNATRWMIINAAAVAAIVLVFAAISYGQDFGQDLGQDLYMQQATLSVLGMT